VRKHPTDPEGDNLTERDIKVIAYWRSLGWTIPRAELTGEALDNFLGKFRELTRTSPSD